MRATMPTKVTRGVLKYAKIESSPEYYNLRLIEKRAEGARLLLEKIKRRYNGFHPGGDADQAK